MNTENLIDNRNRELWQKINKTHDCSIRFVKHTKEYGCYTEGKTAIIYVPESDKTPDSFTHELLHIFLKQKGVFIGNQLKQQMASSTILRRIYSEELLGHIGNCFDHIKMLPFYLQLKFNRELFILDYEKDKCQEQEINQLNGNIKIGLNYNSRVIALFIGKIFAIRACPNEKIDYAPKLNKLKLIDQALFDINNKAIDNWIKVDIEDDDILAYNSRDVLSEYVQEMENWAKNKLIK